MVGKFTSTDTRSLFRLSVRQRAIRCFRSKVARVHLEPPNFSIKNSGQVMKLSRDISSCRRDVLRCRIESIVQTECNKFEGIISTNPNYLRFSERRVFFLSIDFFFHRIRKEHERESISISLIDPLQRHRFRKIELLDIFTRIVDNSAYHLSISNNRCGREVKVDD